MKTTPLIRILLLFAAITVYFSHIHGNTWQIDKQHQLPRPGDKIETDRAFLSSPGEAGKNVVWNFSGVNLESASENIRFLLRGLNCIGVKHRGHCNDYRVTGDTLLYTGYENRTVKMMDSIPAIKMIYPMAYGDSCRSVFVLRGKHSVNLDAYSYGTAEVCADGLGTLVLPGGDSISDVIRVCSELRVHGSLSLKTAGNSVVDRSDVPASVMRQYEWYAQGYRYPLLTVNEEWQETEQGLTLSKRESFIISRFNQEYSVKADPANEDQRELIAKNTARPETDYGSNTPSIHDVKVSASNGKLAIVFESGADNGIVEFAVSDSSGISYLNIPRHRITEGENQIEADCTQLPPGEYALLLVCGPERYSYTFTCR